MSDSLECIRSELLSSVAKRKQIKNDGFPLVRIRILPNKPQQVLLLNTANDRYTGFFWTFRKKLKAKKTQAEKKLKQIFEKLNSLPTKN